MYTVAHGTRTMKKNVIIVLTDDQGYGDFGFTGNPYSHTPNIDRLSEESINFTDFHACPMCAPTRGQLFTGRYAFDNGVSNVFGGKNLLYPDVPTMAECFRDNGYHTGHFGKWHMGENYPSRPEDRGFEETLYFKGSCITSSSDYWTNDCFNDTFVHNGKEEKTDGYITDVFFDKAMEWMGQVKNDGKPFFVNLWTNAPHYPHYCPDSYRNKYEAMDIPDTPVEIFDINGFYGMIENIDDNMGRLKEYLERTRLIDETILIFMTDNGGQCATHIWNAGMRGQKCEYWEGGHRVPCLLRVPQPFGLRPEKIDKLTSVLDVFPTLVDLCGLKTWGKLDGVSLIDSMKKKGDNGRTVVNQMSFLPIDMFPRKWECCVMQDKWRLVGKDGLYDITTDPAQQRNVAEEYPEKLSELREFYEVWWNEHGSVPREKLSYMVLDPEKENPMFLCSHDWFETRCGHKEDVLGAVEQKGPWAFEVAKPGRYNIELRRWPKETDAPLTGSAIFEPHDKRQTRHTFPTAKELQIGWGRIRLFDIDEIRKVDEGAKSVNFEVELPKGRTWFSAQFYHRNMNETWGAYFVYITPIG